MSNKAIMLRTGNASWPTDTFSISAYQAYPWGDPVLMPPADEWPVKPGTLLRPPQVVILSFGGVAPPPGQSNPLACIDIVADAVYNSQYDPPERDAQGNLIPQGTKPLFCNYFGVFFGRPATTDWETWSANGLHVPRTVPVSPVNYNRYGGVNNFLSTRTDRFHWELGQFTTHGFMGGSEPDIQAAAQTIKQVIEAARPGKTFVLINPTGDLVAPTGPSTMLPDLLVLHWGSPSHNDSSYDDVSARVAAGVHAFPRYQVFAWSLDDNRLQPTAQTDSTAVYKTLSGEEWLKVPTETVGSLPIYESAETPYTSDQQNYWASGGDGIWGSMGIWSNYQATGQYNGNLHFVTPQPAGNGVVRGGPSYTAPSPGDATYYPQREADLASRGVPYAYMGLSFEGDRNHAWKTAEDVIAFIANYFGFQAPDMPPNPDPDFDGDDDTQPDLNTDSGTDPNDAGS